MRTGDIVRIGYRHEMTRHPRYGVNSNMLELSGKCLVVKEARYDFYNDCWEMSLFDGGRWSYSKDMFSHYTKGGDNRLIKIERDTY